MFTVWSLPLALVTVGCSMVLLIHGRLTAKYKPVEAGIRALEPLLRQRMDLLYDLAETMTATETAATTEAQPIPLSTCAALLALCETYRDMEWEALCEGHDRTAETVTWLRTKLTTSQPKPPSQETDTDKHMSHWDAFLQTDAPFAEIATAYNQAATAYNAALRPFTAIAGLFLMEPARCLIVF